MAIVAPVTENSVRLQPLPGERFQAADFGGQEIAQGAQRLGNQMQEVSLALRDKYDEAAVKDALNKSQLEMMEAKSGYLAREGNQAPGVLTEAQKRFGEIKETYTKGLASSRQREMFDDVFSKRTASDYEDIGLHENRQVAAWHKATAVATAETSFNSAVSEAAINPEKAQQYVATGLAQFEIMKPGADPIELKLAKDKYVSSYHLSVARSFAERGEEGVVDAEEWIKKAGAAVLPDDQTAFYKSYQPQLEAVNDSTSFGRILSGDTLDDAEPGMAAAPGGANPSKGKSTQELVTGSKRTVSSAFGAARPKGPHSGADYPRPEGSPAYSPAPGKVLKSFYDEAHGGGWTVIVQHPDGRTSGYAHLRAKSPLEIGQTVERGAVVGAVGSTGKSTGFHLHYTVRNAAGNRVDPETQTWDDMPSAARAASKADRRPADTGDREDLASLRERTRLLSLKENWSDAKYQRMLARIDAHVSKQDQLRERAFDDADERVALQLDKLGDGFTSITQINTAGMRPGAVAALKKQAENNRDDRDNAAEGSDRYLSLLDMASDPARQKDFAALPPSSLMVGVSRADGRRLRAMQIEAKYKPGKGFDIGRIRSEVNAVLPAKANDANRERDRMRLLDRLSSEVRAKGREVPDEELLGIARRLVQNVRNVETGEVKPLYKQTGRVAIGVPNSFVARTNAARKAEGLPPYDPEAMRAYWTYRGAPTE